jgi:hypothetical protein
LKGSNVVWLTPSATSFSCLCETCLEAARAGGGSLLDAVRVAHVRGTVSAESDVTFARCSFGHEVVLRRIARPPRLARSTQGQLELV